MRWVSVYNTPDCESEPHRGSWFTTSLPAFIERPVLANTEDYKMITGSMVALVTPMHDDGKIDYAALESLVDWHVKQGTSAIVAVGTTGESATLKVDEHCSVIERVVQVAAGRVDVIAGTGANSTEEAIQLTESAARSGANACLSVTPYYNKPTQQGLYLHHKAIAEAVAIPNILYNVPGRTAVDMQVDTTVRLAAVPNIVGIKDATGDMSRGRELIEQCPKDFAIYSGDDATAAELMTMGGKGDISVTANVRPAEVALLCELAMNIGSTVQDEISTLERVQALNNALMPVHDAMFIESNPIPVKWACHAMGLIGQGIRLPLTTLDVSQRQRVEQAVKTG